MTRQHSGSHPHQANNLRRGRGARLAGPAGLDVRNIDGRIDEQCCRQCLRQHARRGHDADLSNARIRGVTRTRVDDVVVENPTATHGCFTRCFTRTMIRRRTSHRSRRTPRTNSTHTTQRPQVVPGRRQGRHATRRQIHDASDRRGPAMRVAQAGTPRRAVGASPEHRHRRGPHRHQHATRPHGHGQVAARVGGAPLRDTAQVEARTGNIHATDALSRGTHHPPPLANARQQAPRRRPQRRLHNTLRRRGRQGRTRDIRGPHRLDVPRGNERPDQRVERSPGRLRERQRVTQQPVGFFAHDEAGAGHRGISPATGRTVTAPCRSNNRIEPRHLGRRPEHAPHVLVACNNAHDSVDDRHAVPAPADDVDAGAHRWEGGAPHGRRTRGPGHGLVPRGAGEARSLSRRSLRGPCRGRRPWWRRSGREC